MSNKKGFFFTQCCLTIGQLDTQLTSYGIVGHSTARPLDSWILSWPAIERIDTALSDHCIAQLDPQQTSHWTVGRSSELLLDSWTQHWPIIGKLDTTLTSHWTVGHSTDQSLDCWTQYCPTICANSCPTIGNTTYFVYSPNPNCQTEYNLSYRFSSQCSHFLHPCSRCTPARVATLVTLVIQKKIIIIFLK